MYGAVEDRLARYIVVIEVLSVRLVVVGRVCFSSLINHFLGARRAKKVLSPESRVSDFYFYPMDFMKDHVRLHSLMRVEEDYVFFCFTIF